MIVFIIYLCFFDINIVFEAGTSQNVKTDKFNRKYHNMFFSEDFKNGFDLSGMNFHE